MLQGLPDQMPGSLFAFIVEQAFKYVIDDRTKSRILNRQLGALEDHVFIGVRESNAIGWPNFIYPAMIGYFQKWTGRGFNYIISIFIEL